MAIWSLNGDLNAKPKYLEIIAWFSVFLNMYAFVLCQAFTALELFDINYGDIFKNVLL